MAQSAIGLIEVRRKQFFFEKKTKKLSLI